MPLLIAVIVLLGIGGGIYFYKNKKTEVPVTVVQDNNSFTNSTGADINYSTKSPLIIGIKIPKDFKYSLTGEKDANNKRINDWGINLSSKNGLSFGVCTGCDFPMEECGGLITDPNLCIEKNTVIGTLNFTSFTKKDDSKLVLMIGDYFGRNVTISTGDGRQLTQSDLNIVSDLLGSLKKIK